MQVLAAIMPAISKLVESILSPTYDAEKEKEALLALQNAITEARFLQYTQDSKRP